MRKVILICLSLMCGLSSWSQTKQESVIIPEEQFSVFGCTLDDKPAVVVANSSLRKFKSKNVFGWTCSLVIDFKETAENNMPTKEEFDFVLNYFEQLDSVIRGDKNHPNALFLARVTWNGTFEAIWQVNNPEIVSQYLQSIIDDKTYPREMDYRIEKDSKWKKVKWYLQKFPTNTKTEL
ncbi:MAG: DUF695 domain-containing protein [Bacteroidaceae bacterium]|nr:DUF695 domain-containing protein [Bacteroidaceae bacterium]